MISERIREQGYLAATEIIETAKLRSGQILVVGCSTSEILGEKIGTASSPETAQSLFDGIKKECSLRRSAASTSTAR